MNDLALTLKSWISGAINKFGLSLALPEKAQSFGFTTHTPKRRRISASRFLNHAKTNRNKTVVAYLLPSLKCKSPSVVISVNPCFCLSFLAAFEIGNGLSL